ncbi:MAG: ABC transporter ATP-binding protein [Candidatus Krumholzibacteriota bacterium]|nr:ABC transporter ATP-binding protein [Candidatus Krumholzibacteriota bacterium]
MRVELEALSRSFPGVRAVQDVSLAYEPGRLYALVGENGAGKSTLMHLLYGMLPPDAGRILVDGRPVRLAGSQDAIRLGIGMVHQHFMLVDTLTVAENVVLGAEPGRWGRLDRGAARAAVRRDAERFGLAVDPDAPLESLSVGEAQRVEILKVLYRGASFLIFDEPTGVLTPQEARGLFAILRRLRDEGKTVVLISHKLDEVLSVAEIIDVMRRGRHVGRLAREEAGAERLARMMVGREVLLRVDKPPAAAGPPVLEARGLGVRRRPGQAELADVSFILRRGEILGVAGVEGNGQRELAALVTGLLRPEAGELRLDGRPLRGLTPRRARDLGIRHVPEDRQRTGLVLDMSLRENLILGEEGSPAAGQAGVILPGRVAALARRRVAEYDVRVADTRQSARALSGGNQQKLVLARELDGDPRLLVACHPTRGVDVGAIEYIHRTLLAKRTRGLAVLLFSSELSELLALSDRIGVLYRGRLTAVLDADVVDEETLGLYITGARGVADA